MPNNSSAIFDLHLANIYKIRAINRNQKAQTSDNTYLLKQIAVDLKERLSFVSRSFKNAIDLYSHNDLAADYLRSTNQVEHIERVETLAELVSPQYLTRISLVEELALAHNQYDLITSLLALQNVNDIPGLLFRIRHALRPDGLFLAALSGAGTLGELRECLLQAESELYDGATPHIAPFMDVRDAGALLQRAGFALPVADTETITVWYDNMFTLMQDLRSWGMQNALLNRKKTPFSRRFFLRAAEIYQQRFSNSEGKIKVSFSFIWLSGWAPHKDQQQPMRPGSAQNSLVDALQNDCE